MIFGQNDKDVVVINAASVATNATATGIVDTLGFEQAHLRVLLDSSASTTNAPTTLKVSEGDTSTAFSDITELTGGSSEGNFPLPAPTTNVATVLRMSADLRKRKRFLQVSVTPGGADRIVGVIATLSRPNEAPTTDAAMGLVDNVVV